MKFSRQLWLSMAIGLSIQMSSAAAFDTYLLNQTDGQTSSGSDKQLVINRPTASTQKDAAREPQKRAAATPAKEKTTATKTVAKASIPSGTHNVKTLYNLGPEIVMQGEFTSNLKIKNNKFITMTYDTLTYKQSIIVDGEKVMTADEIFPIDISITNPDKMSYYYYIGDDWYAVIDGKKEGPFEWVGFPIYEMTKLYLCDDMGRRFLRDSDGQLYPRNREWADNNAATTPVIFTSTNGQHKIKLTDNCFTITLDGRSNRLPLGWNKVDKLYFQYLSNNGDAFLELYNKNASPEYEYVVVNRNGARAMPEGDFYSALDRATKADGLLVPFGEATELVEKYGQYNNMDLIDFNFTDPSGRHSFTSNWDEDYVTIDGKRIACNAPIYAFFDDNLGAFAWVTEENGKLLMHSYTI